MSFDDDLTYESCLEYCFLKYILRPASRQTLILHVYPQFPVEVGERSYKLDYAILGERLRVAIELDGYAFHSDRRAFSYDRMRQNDLQTSGFAVLRFSYDSIRTDTRRCIEQFRALMLQDPLTAQCLRSTFSVPQPQMDPNPLFAANPAIPGLALSPQEENYFETARRHLNVDVLRICQYEALQALTNYFATGARNKHAACVMSVGAGKTVLGIVAALAFCQKRALIVSPANVIRKTFDKALDPHRYGNVLHHLPSGPLLPGCRVPEVLVLDGERGSISSISAKKLLEAEIIITNYHVLGDGTDAGDLLYKLAPDDIDFLVIDEAHIAAADSYQRLFDHFSDTRAILMSACFQRMDGKPIEADVVYRYRLIDSINDGVAKRPVLHRHVADPSGMVYEVRYPDGYVEEVSGKDNLLEIVDDERRLSTITAKSLEPMRQVMSIVRQRLDYQTQFLYPVKPRILLSALSKEHAAQIAGVAREFGISCAYLHYSMGAAKVRRLRERFERDSGALQALVHLKMLGQGYDFPKISIVVPMRPYGSFAEFYQFIGRGIRVVPEAHGSHLPPEQQILDIVFHSEFGLMGHLETLRREDDMGPFQVEVTEGDAQYVTFLSGDPELQRVAEQDAYNTPSIEVLRDEGVSQSGILHSKERLEQRQAERELEAFSVAYARYVEGNPNPISFDEFVNVVKGMRND